MGAPRAHRAVIAACAIGGCVSQQDGTFAVPSGTLATVALVYRPGALEPISATAFRSADIHHAITLTRGRDTSVYLFFYSRTLDELQIDEGEIERAPSESASRPLPPPSSALNAVPGDGPLSWRSIALADLPAAVADFRIAAFDYAKCADSGGCLDRTSDRYCLSPCPTPPAPKPVTRPQLTPCRGGWMEVDLGIGTPICAPRARPIEVPCDPGELQLWDRAECESIGDPCAPDGWPAPANLPADRPIIYTWELAAGPPDGSRAFPYRSIDEAIRNAPARAVVAVHTGDYRELVRVPGGIAIAGACPHSTIIIGPVIAAGAGVELANLTIRSAAANAVTATVAGRSVDVKNTLLDEAGGNGVFAAGGARATISHSLITGCEARGVYADSGASVEVKKTVILECTVQGVLAHGPGTRALVEEVIVRRTTGSPALGLVGDGLVVENGATASVSRALFESNHYQGIGVYVAGAAVNDVIIADTRAVEGTLDGGDGFYLEIGTATLARTLITGNPRFALGANRGAMWASDVLVERTLRTDGNTSAGLLAVTGAHVIAKRIAIVETTGVGVLVTELGAILELDDAIIHRVHAPAPDRADHGFSLGQDSSTFLRRVMIDDLPGIGLLAAGSTVAPGAMVEASSFSARRVGMAVQMTRNATGVFDGIHFEENGSGVILYGEAKLSVNDAILSGRTPPAPVSFGIEAADGSELHLSAFSIRGYGVGLLTARENSDIFPVMLDIHDGLISENLVGANILRDDVEPWQLMRGVVYKDNATSLIPAPPGGGR